MLRVVPADHISVEAGYCVVNWDHRVIGIVARAEQAELFCCYMEKQNTSLGLVSLFLGFVDCVCNTEQGSRSTTIVLRTVMSSVACFILLADPDVCGMGA